MAQVASESASFGPHALRRFFFCCTPLSDVLRFENAIHIARADAMLSPRVNPLVDMASKVRVGQPNNLTAQIGYWLGLDLGAT